MKLQRARHQTNCHRDRPDKPRDMTHDFDSPSDVERALGIHPQFGEELPGTGSPPGAATPSCMS